MEPDPAVLAEAQWQRFAESVRARYGAFFDGDGPIVGARAPGRMDILGGVADYSGGTVLEATLAEATLAAVQERPGGVVRLRSLEAVHEGLAETVAVPLDMLFGSGGARPYPEVNAAIADMPGARWAGYAAGCLLVLVAEGKLDAGRATGLNVLVDSDVPVGAGVSSSAALEVAVMAALCRLYGLEMDGLELARLCQIVENRVVGAPCGIMDQVTSALGQADHLLVLKCQPHEVLGHQRIPPGWRFVGIDSHVKHSVGGSNYTRARVAAFMGLKVLQVESRDSWNGYLCNVAPDVWTPWRERLPETLTGARFLARYGELPDTVTRVDPHETYHVRSAAEHPILENDRVRQFLALMSLAGAEIDPQLMKEAGALMVEAHQSYSSRIHLGSPETDLLVELAMRCGPRRGIFGAKITGGGSGGTVAILCAGPHADAAIEDVAAEYARRSGRTPRVMKGSSPGALAFGARIIP